MITAGRVKISAKTDYVIQSLIFKSLLMNSSMKIILALAFLVWMVKRYPNQDITTNDDAYWNGSCS